MSFNILYFIIVLGFGFICVVIGFISGPRKYKKAALSPIPVPVGIGYTSFDFQAEEQNFLKELNERRMDQKPNRGENYQYEKEKRDVDAFLECYKLGLFK